jgi:hypothetical protein
MKTNRAIEAFYRVKRIEIPDIEPLSFKYVWNTVVLPLLVPMKRLPSLNYKPRKTTYKTVKRFSAKRNR